MLTSCYIATYMLGNFTVTNIQELLANKFLMKILLGSPDGVGTLTRSSSSEKLQRDTFYKILW